MFLDLSSPNYPPPPPPPGPRPRLYPACSIRVDGASQPAREGPGLEARGGAAAAAAAAEGGGRGGLHEGVVQLAELEAGARVLGLAAARPRNERPREFGISRKVSMASRAPIFSFHAGVPRLAAAHPRNERRGQRVSARRDTHLRCLGQPSLSVCAVRSHPTRPTCRVKVETVARRGIDGWM